MSETVSCGDCAHVARSGDRWFCYAPLPPFALRMVTLDHQRVDCDGGRRDMAAYCGAFTPAASRGLGEVPGE